MATMNHVRELRQARGWSMRELAEKMSEQGEVVHFTTIAKIERSQRKMTIEWAMRFAEAFGVQPNEVIGEEVAGIFPIAGGQIPVIGMVAAGNWREAVQETTDYIAAPVAARRAFGLVVEGDSMDKVTPEGSTVLIDPDDCDLRDGDYYVVQNGDGEATFKRFRAEPARLEPCSNNPSHTVIMLGNKPFTITGRVVGVYQKL